MASSVAEPGIVDGAPRAVPVLFLLADTGGGHRAAAKAVGQALERGFPGLFAPILCDPLSGPGAHRLVRRVTRLYGPLIRTAPWLWMLLYHGTDRRPADALLGRVARASTRRPVRQAMNTHRPRVVVSFHPLLGGCAVEAGRATGAAAITVVTDLVTGHRSWRHDADVVVVPSSAMYAWFRRSSAGRCLDLGLPVGPAFGEGPLNAADRVRLRRRLGLDSDGFVVVVSGGGEGGARLGRQARILARRFPDIEVVAICGRDERLCRSLGRFAARTGARLTVRPYVDDIADWVRCADLLVTKAGPGTIAEAACLATPLLIAWRLPGQERGNAEFLTAAGAARRVRGARQLLREVERLRGDRGAMKAMREAAARLARPGASDDIAELIARVAQSGIIKEGARCEA